MDFFSTRDTDSRKSGTSGLLAAALTTLMLVTPLMALSDELVVNGGFEEPNLEDLGYGSNSWTTFFGQNVFPADHCSSNGLPACNGDILVPGWSVYWSDGTMGRLEIQRGFVGGSYPDVGDQKAELDSHHRVNAEGVEDLENLDHNVTLVQELKTCPRAPYALSYSWKPRTLEEDDNDMLVLIDGEFLVSHTNLVNEWNTESYNFIAKDSGFSGIAFESLGLATTLGMYLDDVSVQGPDGSNPEACEQVPVCGSKPAELEMLYNGPFSDGDFHSQDPDQVVIETFTEDPLPNTVFIKAYDHLYGKKNAGHLFEGSVDLGETFSFTGTKGRKALVPPKITIEIHADGALLQRVSFHSSCSQPLNVGDQFGGVAIFGFTP